MRSPGARPAGSDRREGAGDPRRLVHRVDVAQLAARPGPSVRPRPGRPGSGERVGPRHRYVAQHGGSGRVAERQHPPTAVVGRPEHRVVVVQPPAATASRSAAVTCGVSMPTWTIGPAPAPATSRGRRPAARRARRRAAGARSSRRGRVAAPPTGRRRSRSPSSARWQLGRRPTGTRPACRAVRRRRASAAVAMPISAPSRVFTRPGTGALATTSALMPRPPPRTAPARSREPRARCHAPTPDDLRPGAGGARVVGDVALGEPPAGHGRLLQQLDRVAEPPVLDVRGRAAPRGGRPASGRCRGPAARSAAQPPDDEGVAERGRATARRRGDRGAGARRARSAPPPADRRRAAPAGRPGRTSRRRP